ncbi:phage resistance protein [Streptococcus iniae]|uniref:phage resistance protein n=1 Tax=Streptococcus iniae TaxID=1346 RepID=UPI000EF77771|nr:phage resistance protein [Streptococcus iniae]RLV09636.1 phage resistance protein [Streptococcus iniae]
MGNEYYEIKQVIYRIFRSTRWGTTKYGTSSYKAEYRRSISYLQPLDQDYRVPIKEAEFTGAIADSDISYITTNGLKTYEFAFGYLQENKKTKIKEFVSTKVSHPPLLKLIADYIIGCFAIVDGKIFDISQESISELDDYRLQLRYDLKGIDHARELLLGIHEEFNIKPVKQMERYVIACNDFLIDVKNSCIIDQLPDNKVCYFKRLNVSKADVKPSKEIADKFLKMVTNDDNSYFNATLQTWYMMQVASGVRAKTNFFVSKSKVRTGKGLRHIALQALFECVPVELDVLTGGSFEAMQGWSLFSGGEMALATEQGDIQGLKLERVLKIIATEKSHVTRGIGQNISKVNLTAVLCIDTNRTVALSDEMNGRKVLIQFRDRPEGETDVQREDIFRPFWEAFTDEDKEPLISGCIGFLLNAMELFQKENYQYVWREVELINEFELDPVQLQLVQLLQKTDYILRNDALANDIQKTYKTTNLFGKALSEIGIGAYKKKIDGEPRQAYKVVNKERFDNIVSQFE